MQRVRTINRIADVSVVPPSAEDLVGRATRLIPALAARAVAGDCARSVAPETMAELGEAGLFRILQPRRWGGYEQEPGVLFAVQIALGRGDLSTAWVYGTLASLNGLLALFDDRAAQDVWADDSGALICCSMMRTGNAVPVKGGFRLTGRWRYLSGCTHAGWAMLGGNVAAEGSGGDVRIFLVPRADIELVDTWHVAGLKATGSHDAVVTDAFVPGHRTQKFADCFRCEGAGQAVNPAPLYRVPFGQIFARTPSAGSIGALQGMLDTFREHAAARVAGAGGRMAEDPVAQLVCAETASAIDEMTIVLRRNFASLMAATESGQAPPLADRLQYKFQSAAAAERCSLLAARLFKAAGAAALFDDRPFGRFLADITAARQHIANQYEAFGRSWGASLLGGESAADFFL